MAKAPLPEWADEWGPAATKCCGKRVVICYGWGREHTVCQVSGLNVGRCPGDGSVTADTGEDAG